MGPWQYVFYFGFLWYIGSFAPLIFWFVNSQIYSLARVAALLCIIVGVVLMNTTSPINCQVGTMVKYLPFHSRALTGHDFKAGMSTNIVGTISYAPQLRRGEAKSLTIVFFLLLGFILSDSVRIFAIDCSSGVRPSTIYGTTISPIQVFIETASIAIWNANRTIVAIAIGIWGINIAFLVQGESVLQWGPCQWNPILISIGNRCCKGEYRP